MQPHSPGIHQGGLSQERSSSWLLFTARPNWDTPPFVTC